MYKWRHGIVTRGVLLDVPRFRKKPYVTMDEPVHGWELEDIAKAQGVTVTPGDALLVYSGREKFTADHPQVNLGEESPGLHADCLPFIRDHDVALLGWDLMDAQPNEYNMRLTVHWALSAYGVPLLDNPLLEPAADYCAANTQYTFMLTVAPLAVEGGTGSPVNPIAVF